MQQNNIVLTGVPRSGTTMICRLLNMSPNTVALDEPIKLSQFRASASREDICTDVVRFFEHTRASLLKDRRALSKDPTGIAGPVNRPEVPPGHEPIDLGTRGEVHIDKPLDEALVLCIKEPAAFSALLETLVTRFPCFAIIRNPIAVLESWSKVTFRLRKGRSPAAERLDRRLAEELGRISDKIDRQIYLLSWFYGKYRAVLPEDKILRYEDIVASGGSTLGRIVPRAYALAEELPDNNWKQWQDPHRMQRVGERLLKTDGALWEFYTKESVRVLLERNQPR